MRLKARNSALKLAAQDLSASDTNRAPAHLSNRRLRRAENAIARKRRKLMNKNGLEAMGIKLVGPAKDGES